MPRKYYRKTSKVCPRAIEEGVKAVIERGISQRQVCKDFEVPRTTLQRYLKEYKSNTETNLDVNYDKSSTKNRVFTDKMESDLKDYLLQASLQLHGLTKSHLRDLAYEFAREMVVLTQSHGMRTKRQE